MSLLKKMKSIDFSRMLDFFSSSDFLVNFILLFIICTSLFLYFTDKITDLKIKHNWEIFYLKEKHRKEIHEIKFPYSEYKDRDEINEFSMLRPR